MATLTEVKEVDLNYEQDINIDETALDLEWKMQPMLMMRYCAHMAHAKKALDLASERLDVRKAKLDKEIRSNPEKYGLSKITETALGNTILLQPEYEEANKEYIEAKYEYEMVQAAVRAMDQKKSALENLVKLLGMSYFAGPTTPRDLSEEWEKKQAERQREINKMIKIGKEN